MERGVAALLVLYVVHDAAGASVVPTVSGAAGMLHRS